LFWEALVPLPLLLVLREALLLLLLVLRGALHLLLLAWLVLVPVPKLVLFSLWAQLPVELQLLGELPLVQHVALAPMHLVPLPLS
jgi:hypothetical protein